MDTEKEFEGLHLAEDQRRENLGISSDYIFGKVMLDKDLCLGLIRRILPDMEILDISMPESQKSLKADADARGVRFDVFLRDQGGAAYDIEMEVRFSGHLPERTRYYASMIDMLSLDKGVPYKELKPCVIIFICPFDPFGSGRHIYTFRNFCVQQKDLELKDGTTKIFLNARGVKDDVSPELKAFLDYVAGISSEDAYVQKLAEAVEKSKIKREWRKEYMTLMMRDQENFDQGVEQGKKKIVLNLYQDGFGIDTIARLAEMDAENVKKWIEEKTETAV